MTSEARKVGTVTISAGSEDTFDEAFYLTCSYVDSEGTPCDWADETWSSDSATNRAESHDFTHSYITEGRSMLAFLDQHRDLLSYGQTPPIRSCVYFYDDNDYNEVTKEWTAVPGTALRKMAEMAQSLGGKWDKDTNSLYFTLTRSFGPHRIVLEAPRDAVCTARVVGTETKTVRKAVDFVEVKETRDVIEWDCPQSLLALTQDQA